MPNTNIFSDISFNDGGKGNKYQPDVPAVGATAMKAILDELPDHIIVQLNQKLSDMSADIVDYVNARLSTIVPDPEHPGQFISLGDMMKADYHDPLFDIDVSHATGINATITSEMLLVSNLDSNLSITFYYDDGVWKNADGVQVDPQDYGVSLNETGTVSDGDYVTITYYPSDAYVVDNAISAAVADNLSFINKDNIAQVSYVDDEIARVETQIQDQIVDYIVDDGHTLAVEDWVESSGIFSQSIGGTSDTIDVTSSDHPRIYPNFQDDSSEYGDISDAWGEVTAAIAGDGTITFYCSYNKPAVDIPLIIEIIRSNRSEGGGS